MSEALGAGLLAPFRRLWRRVHRRAERFRSPMLEAGTVITLRLAAAGSDAAVEQLIELSGQERPHGPSLVAEVNGEPRAALSLEGGAFLADPFHPSSELGSLLTLRLAQLEAKPGPAPGLCA